jgi:hypothetical protein
MDNEEKTIDGVSVLSKLTGLPKGDIAGIWEEVQINNQLLSECPYHEFELNRAVLSDRLRSRHKMYICRHCCGTISESMYRWHEIGRRPKP